MVSHPFHPPHPPEDHCTHPVRASQGHYVEAEDAERKVASRLIPGAAQDPTVIFEALQRRCNRQLCWAGLNMLPNACLQIARSDLTLDLAFL